VRGAKVVLGKEEEREGTGLGTREFGGGGVKMEEDGF